jgi:hypothetical protein
VNEAATVLLLGQQGPNSGETPRHGRSSSDSNP